MPIDYSKYPSDWGEIRYNALGRANHACQGSPGFYPNCRVRNYETHPQTGSKVVLTIAHLNHDTNDNRYENLRAMCQRCHNAYDGAYRAKNRAETKRKKIIDSGQMELKL